MNIYLIQKEPQVRGYALYLDDDGGSWSAGMLLPEGWTECQIAEMRNGSVLMASQLQGKVGRPPWQPSTSITAKQIRSRETVGTTVSCIAARCTLSLWFYLCTSL